MPHDTLVLPIPNAFFIWRCAWMSIFSAGFAWSHPKTAHFAIVPLGVFVSSLNYWRYPIRNSWRRWTDITVVFSGLTYQSYYAYTIHDPVIDSTYLNRYVYLIVLSSVCYGLSNYFMGMGCIWAATYAHASIHLVANIANIMLYNGYRC